MNANHMRAMTVLGNTQCMVGDLEPGYSEVALKVYNTTPLTDKYVRVSKIERIGDALQSILKIKKTDGG